MANLKLHVFVVTWLTAPHNRRASHCTFFDQSSFNLIEVLMSEQIPSLGMFIILIFLFSLSVFLIITDEDNQQ